MKRFFSFLLVCALIISCCSTYVSADQVTTEMQTSIEYFEDGSYVITTFEETSSLARAAKSGQKTKSYYTSNDVLIFAVTLTGTFSYTYGQSATATGANTVVYLYHDDAEFITKSATYRNATAYGSGTVSYFGVTRAISTNITCDIYGNLS